MTNWALVENNQVIELHTNLPKNWKNISGLNLSSDNLPYLATLGWYQVEKLYTELETLNKNITKFSYNILADRVQESIAEYTAIIEPTFEELKSRFLTELRNKRNELLKESDWTQLQDTQSILSEAEKLSWLNYRQALRDLPEQYVSDDTINIALVSWPGVP